MTDLQIAIEIIKKANKLLAQSFRPSGAKTLHFKKQKEIVTRIDIISNNLITKELLKYFPNDDIVSEEAKKINNPGKKIWYIDPLDGTTNFSYGFREFGVCLSRTNGAKIDIGIIGIPLAQEIFWVQNGKPAFLNGKKISVSTQKKSDRHMIFLCDGHSLESKEKFTKILERLDIKDFRARVFSAASVELSSVACGRADGCILPESKPWDVLAGIQLIRAAGGKATNFAGQEWTQKDSDLIASNSIIHKQLLQLVK